MLCACSQPAHRFYSTINSDALLALGVKPWIELGYTPCFISGPPAVPRDSYWPTVDYGICVGPPTSVAAWTDLIDQYVAACVTRYGEAPIFQLQVEPTHRFLCLSCRSGYICSFLCEYWFGGVYNEAPRH